MGKHSAPKTHFTESVSDFFRAFGRRRQGRHSDIDEEPTSAASILRSAKKMPNWAALAVPTAAVASLAVSGIMLAPNDSGTQERVVFSDQEQPKTGPAFAKPVSADSSQADKIRKDWDDAVNRSKETREPGSITGSLKPTPPPAPADPTGSSSSDSSAKPSKSSKGKSTKEPKQNTEASGKSGTCKASFYGTGSKTANGESYNPNGITAAHKTLPFNSKVKVTNKSNGKSVTVRINDRGPFVSGRCLDLSTGAMKAVGGTGAGVITVDWEVL